MSGDQPPATKWFQRIVLVDTRADWPHRSDKPSALEREHIRLLPAFPGIRAIAVDGRTIGTEEFKAIGRLRSLEQLWIDEGVQLSSEDLTLLRGLSNLRCLTIRNAPIGDEGVSHLSKLPRLEELDLSQCEVSDDGVVHLGSHRTLRSLSLQDNRRITGDALRELAGVQSLQRLNLLGTGVTYEAVEEFALTRERIWIDISASIGGSSILDSAGNVRIVSW
jgi:Leucine-rich repeat (LRR) protein